MDIMQEEEERRRLKTEMWRKSRGRRQEVQEVIRGILREKERSCEEE
jgi:hypothetical protein